MFKMEAVQERKPLEDMTQKEQLTEVLGILRGIQDALVGVADDPMIRALGGGGMAGLTGLLGIGRK